MFPEPPKHALFELSGIGAPGAAMCGAGNFPELILSAVRSIDEA
jgi:hypothetical protein